MTMSYGISTSFFAAIQGVAESRIIIVVHSKSCDTEAATSEARESARLKAVPQP